MATQQPPVRNVYPGGIPWVWHFVPPLPAGAHGRPKAAAVLDHRVRPMPWAPVDEAHADHWWTVPYRAARATQDGAGGSSLTTP